MYVVDAYVVLSILMMVERDSIANDGYRTASILFCVTGIPNYWSSFIVAVTLKY
jgi:hypothetical protein